jgi:hypothetical protein
VRCTIVATDGRAVTGENWCENPQPICPRLDDEGYDKCHSVCMQLGHAEEVALDMARAAALPLAGGLAVIAGHERTCSKCTEALNTAGITQRIMGIAWL